MTRAEEFTTLKRFSAWTPEQDAVVVKLYPDNDTKEIARIIGRSPAAVMRRANALKVKKSAEANAKRYKAASAKMHRYLFSKRAQKGQENA